MIIDKSRLKAGIWYTDKDDNEIQSPMLMGPDGAVYAHVCFPLEITEKIYRIRSDGGYGEKDRVATATVALSRGSGRLAVAMVNSGDYELDEALAVLAQACERCVNVLWNRYLPDEDGYPEFSEEWWKCGTVCDFCRNLGDGKSEAH